MNLPQKVLIKKTAHRQLSRSHHISLSFRSERWSWKRYGGCGWRWM